MRIRFLLFISLFSVLALAACEFDPSKFANRMGVPIGNSGNCNPNIPYTEMDILGDHLSDEEYQCALAYLDARKDKAPDKKALKAYKERFLENCGLGNKVCACIIDDLSKNYADKHWRIILSVFAKQEPKDVHPDVTDSDILDTDYYLSKALEACR